LLSSIISTTAVRENRIHRIRYSLHQVNAVALIRSDEASDHAYISRLTLRS
ncbi:hypothetical protein M9458_031294, partial [Cirrhinus mrigala]